MTRNTLLDDLPANTPILLDNTTCVYCSRPIDADSRTKEHVIGRRFVPRGKLDGQWNLIVWACSPCNARKANLENDLSAITMQPDAAGRFVHTDRSLISEAERKGKKAVSRRTGKPVKGSRENLKFKMQFAPGVEITFDMIAPPQMDRERVFELARLHAMAFFYWVTFNPSSGEGGFWPGGFFPVLEVANADWGNPIHRAFMDAVVEWEPRVLAVTADGFFKISIRRHPTAESWSWAIEWNRNRRIVGFFGDRSAAETVAAGFPPLDTINIAKDPGHYVGYRREMALFEADDKLFFWDDIPE